MTVDVIVDLLCGFFHQHRYGRHKKLTKYQITYTSSGLRQLHFPARDHNQQLIRIRIIAAIYEVFVPVISKLATLVRMIVFITKRSGDIIEGYNVSHIGRIDGYESDVLVAFRAKEFDEVLRLLIGAEREKWRDYFPPREVIVERFGGDGDQGASHGQVAFMIEPCIAIMEDAEEDRGRFL